MSATSTPCNVEGCDAPVAKCCNACAESYCTEHTPALHPHALVDLAEQAALQKQQRKEDERARCSSTLTTTTDMHTIAKAMRDFPLDAHIRSLALERVRDIATTSRRALLPSALASSPKSSTPLPSRMKTPIRPSAHSARSAASPSTPAIKLKLHVRAA